MGSSVGETKFHLSPQTHGVSSRSESALIPFTKGNFSITTPAQIEEFKSTVGEVDGLILSPDLQVGTWRVAIELDPRQLTIDNALLKAESRDGF